MHEFYQFKHFKKEKMVTGKDYEALEEDLEFIVHNKVVSGQVNKILTVLSRILNSTKDKKLR